MSEYNYVCVVKDEQHIMYHKDVYVDFYKEKSKLKYLIKYKQVEKTQEYGNMLFINTKGGTRIADVVYHNTICEKIIITYKDKVIDVR